MRAITVLEPAIAALPPAYRRDRGVGLGHQAAAFVSGDEPARAARAATEALGIARDSGSGRVLSMVVSVADRLAPHSSMAEVAGLRAALAQTPAV